MTAKKATQPKPKNRPSNQVRNPNKKKNRKRRARKQPKTMTSLSCLSPIACAYVDALANPETAMPVGIPNGDTLYSRKERVWCRGSKTFGATNKTVHCLVQPFAAVANDLDVISVVADGTGFPNSLQNTGSQYTNAPFSSSQFATSTGVAARLVGAKLRVRYIGSRLNAGGIHYGLQEPTHGGICGLTETNIMATTCGEKRPIGPKEPWFEVTYRPVDHNDTSWIEAITRSSAYQYTLKSDGFTVADGQYPFMGTISVGAVAGETIEWEFWAIVEYSGPLVTGKTITPPDLQGWAAAIAAHSKFDEQHAQTQTRKAEQQSSYLADSIKTYASAMLNAAAPYVQAGAGYAARSLFNTYMAPRIGAPRRYQNLLQ